MFEVVIYFLLFLILLLLVILLLTFDFVFAFDFLSFGFVPLQQQRGGDAPQ